MSDSCAGACCAVFPIDEWQVERMRRKPEEFTDGPYIVDMLIPLTYVEAVARYDRLGYGTFPEVWAPADWYNRWDKRLFTCRHWDEETRLCGDYANRPKMCSTYPYGSACERGCGYQVPKQATQQDDFWKWDEAAQGWRLVPQSKYTWDGEYLREKDAAPREGSSDPAR